MFKKIVDGYNKWETCLIQYNFMDTERQVTQKGLEYAASKNIGIFVMGPLSGGRLANPPKDIVTTFNSYSKSFSPTEWALRWVYNQKSISTILSGVSSLEQIKDNIRIANSCENLVMDEKELYTIAKVKAVYQNRLKINCTRCNYCLPCPEGVNIPQNFDLYNDIFIFNNANAPMTTYQFFTTNKIKASNCTQCRECETKCPQKLEISTLLQTVDAELSKPIKGN
jgi:predicted aldo/keto reductase-like oxidoreductase